MLVSPDTVSSMEASILPYALHTTSLVDAQELCGQLDVKLVVDSVPADVWQNCPTLLAVLGRPLRVRTLFTVATPVQVSFHVQTNPMYDDVVDGKLLGPHFFE